MYRISFLCSLAFCLSAVLSAQNQQKPSADDLGFGHGLLDLQSNNMRLQFVKDSQTLVSLDTGIFAEKASDPSLNRMSKKIADETASRNIQTQFSNFNFLPTDRQQFRNANGFAQFGDLNLRLREKGEADWKSYSPATKRAPVAIVSQSKTTLTSDLAATYPSDIPLKVIRTWKLENGSLALTFEITNTSKSELEIGALGIPLILNNIISDRDLKEAHERCVFSDPYIGLDGGYVQVTRLKGTGQALVIAPHGRSPFEAYHLVNEPGRPNQTFEGMFEWMIHTKAYAESEWKSAQQWNDPTSSFLKPGEKKVVGLDFYISPSIRQIESTLASHKRPVAVGIPGYILPTDQEASLFLRSNRSVRNLSVEPAGSLSVTRGGQTKGGYQKFDVRAKGWGRSRLTIDYSDGSKQTVHYYLTKPASQVVADMGNFLATKQYFTDKSDPFHRAPSFISYDREADKQVTQDSRVWISGLGDEGGSGSFVAMAMKLFLQPNKEEVGKFEDFVDGVLWGGIQFKDGPNKFGVKKSIFYYEPKMLPNFQYDSKLNWTSWTSWNLKASEDIGRGYNYPHTVASYWAMYRVARNHPELATHHDWKWYLTQAFETTSFMTSKDVNGNPRVWYVDLGLMEGTIFINLLEDLKREGWTEQANLIESRMKARATKWIAEEYPFGSEMAWDSTGQEEVYGWCKYFGREDKALVSLNSIVGYMPTLPHWGYNGNARRYWDFLYGGKLSRIERQLHHYGSGLNAIPMLTEYREHPEDFYLLRAGYGGAMGALSNISAEGCASVAFHSFPSTLKWDAYTGDYGPNFFGHALNAATYLVNHPDFGWVTFGGNVQTKGDTVTVTPLDSYRQRVYLSSVGLWLTLDSGQFDSVELNTRTKEVRIHLSGSNNARLVLSQPAKIKGGKTYHLEGKFSITAGAFDVPLKQGKAEVTLL